MLTPPSAPVPPLLGAAAGGDSSSSARSLAKAMREVDALKAKVKTFTAERRNAKKREKRKESVPKKVKVR